MAADLSVVRMNYVLQMQAVEKQLLLLNAQLTALSSLYNGAGLSGTFLDAELAANNATKHMTSADVGTYTSNLQTVQAALTSGIVQNAEKCVGTPV